MKKKPQTGFRDTSSRLIRWCARVCVVVCGGGTMFGNIKVPQDEGK